MNINTPQVSVADTHESPQEPASPSQEHTLYDVIIAGGGITGITAALLLQSAGKKCLFADTEQIIRQSHYLPGYLLSIPLTQDQTKAKLIANLSGAAIDFIEELVTQNDLECDLKHLPAFLVGASEDAKLDAAIDNAVEAGLVIAANEHAPLPLTLKKSYRVEFQSSINPVLYVEELLKAFKSHGGSVIDDCTDTDITNTTHCILKTSTQTIEGRQGIIPSPTENAIKHYAIAFTLKDHSSAEAITLQLSPEAYTIAPGKINGQQCLIAYSKNEHSALEQILHNQLPIDAIIDQWIYTYPEGDLMDINMSQENSITYFKGIGEQQIIGGTIAGKILSDLITGQKDVYSEIFQQLKK